MAQDRFRHIILKEPPAQESFKSIGSRGSEKRIPPRDRQFHSEFLSNRFKQAWETAKNEQAVAHVERNGVYIEFKSDPGADLVTKSLEDMRSKKVRLLNIRTVEEHIPDEVTGEIEEKITTYATVYVSHEKKEHFLKKIQEYAEKETEKGNPRNADLINSIGGIRKALRVDSFWQDLPDLKPSVEPEWCEVWLSNHTQDVIDRFEVLLEKEQIEAREGTVRFPERTVKVIHASREQLEQLSTLSDDIAEYRRAKDTTSFWTEMENREQAEWVKDLLQRSHTDFDTNVAVCILDTGVNNGHPLIAPVLRDEDCLTVNPDWGVHDHDRTGSGHGTRMAGLSTYGDIMKCLASQEPITLCHCLESVKILPPEPYVNQPDLWGYITAQGISRAEIQAPERKRIICMAVTASDTRDRGYPSSWSGALDQLASGAEDGLRRLLIVCSGNLTDLALAYKYPDSELEDSVHDPAQSWNALTVGA